MKFKVNSPVSTAIAIGTGLITLLGFFLMDDTLQFLKKNILDTALVLAATAFVMGVINLLGVHLKKMREGSGYSVYSGVLVITMLITFVITFLQPQGEWAQFIFSSIQIPVESTLMAVLTISLIMAVFRLVQNKPTATTWVFIVTIILTLASSLVVFGLEIPLLGDVFSKLLASSGARGILLGVSLGTIATGLRILIGADKPYGN